MAGGARRFTDLRAWQACDAYKKAVYDLCLDTPLLTDWKRRDQLEESVAGPPAHVAEGFGRFSPPQFANFLVYARSSLMESQNHLRDAVDKRYITEATRLRLDAMAVTALEEVTGLMEYLQSPEALRNARRARERRAASRPDRLAKRGPQVKPAEIEPTSMTPQTPEPEPRTPNSEPEPRTRTPNQNSEPELRTANPELRTPNREPRTANP
jgi:four helix bundle protein